ncbi:MAG TPA: Gfo/Idh/MocA family oxidoreductase [Conexibacter sp.]|nr:Gfo/Idh/MocA family oxidoreductase [Conexibacter sp.]
MSARARIGIVGAGYWAAEFYLPFLRAQEDVELVGVVRRGRDALDALQRAFSLSVASEQVEELLDAGCDGIVVASPNPWHRAHAEAALRAGAHVLVEKPMTVTLADARALEAVARESGRSLSLAHGWNHNPIATWAADLVATGVLGRLTSIDLFMASYLADLFSGRSGYGTVEHGGHRFEADPATWSNPGEGGGYLYGQLSHGLALALSLVPSEPVEVFARMSRLDNGVDLDVTTSVRFADGVVGAFSGHGRLPWGTRKPLTVRLAGEHGSLALDFERDRAEAFVAPDRAAVVPGVGGWLPLALDLRRGEGLYDNVGPTRALVDRCLGRPVVERAPAALGVRCVAVMEAATASAASGAPVAIPEVATHAR